jgi:micrococcal nuclease
VKKRLAVALIAAAAGGATWWAGGERPRSYEAGACRAVDGDTLECAGRRVRLANIAAPELHGRCAAETQMAERAKLVAMIALTEAPARVVPEGRDDRYGRLLARVAIDGKDLGETLIALGLARPYAGGQRRGWCG